MIPITPDQILRLAPNSLLLYRKAFMSAGPVLAEYGINANPLRLSHFMAQILHESGGLNVLEENLNYSAEGLLATFGKRITHALAQKIGRTATQRANREAIAEAVYGGAWGKKNLGNTVPGDGWRYRGRGLTQLTGRANYRRIGKRLGVDLEAKPELVLDPRYVLRIPCVYWKDGKCNALADRDDLRAVTKAVNGGHVGIADRAEWLAKTKREWS